MFNFFKKSLKFIFRYLINDPVFIFKYGYYYFQKDFIVKANFLSLEETAKQIESGKSFIRLGDGEISLLHGRSIHYEDYKTEIKKVLIEIIENYTGKSKYILAIPKFVNETNWELKKINFFRCWLPLKIEFKRRFKPYLFYANAHAFYIKDFFDKDLIAYFKMKKLIILTTQKNIERLKDHFQKDFNILAFIEAKEPNPFDWYEKNKTQIFDILQKNKNINKNDIIILISAGPTGKMLAFYFSNLDYQAIDLGHGIEQLYNNERDLEKEFNTIKR